MEKKSYSIAKLKAGLSSIIGEVAKGGEIIVTDHNKAVARIVPVSRIPPLPRGNLEAFFKTPPVKLRPGGMSAAALIRAIRDEE
jgi:prevent-host-death family protein